MITVSVTEKHIRDGKRADCYECAVTLAVREAVGKEETSIVETPYDGWWVLVDGVSARLPHAAKRLARAIDDHEGPLPEVLPPDIQPLTFELPDLDDASEDGWQPDCYECGERYPDADLDDEGVCADCRKKAGAP